MTGKDVSPKRINMGGSKICLGDAAAFRTTLPHLSDSGKGGNLIRSLRLLERVPLFRPWPNNSTVESAAAAVPVSVHKSHSSFIACLLPASSAVVV